MHLQRICTGSLLTSIALGQVITITEYATACVARYTSGIKTITLVQITTTVSPSPSTEPGLNNGLPFVLEVLPSQSTSTQKRSQAPSYLTFNGSITKDLSQAGRYSIQLARLLSKTGQYISTSGTTLHEVFAISPVLDSISTSFEFETNVLQWTNSAFEKGVAKFYMTGRNTTNQTVIALFNSSPNQGWTPISLIARHVTSVIGTMSSSILGSTTVSTFLIGSMTSSPYSSGNSNTHASSTTSTSTSTGHSAASSTVKSPSTAITVGSSSAAVLNSPSATIPISLNTSVSLFHKTMTHTVSTVSGLVHSTESSVPEKGQSMSTSTIGSTTLSSSFSSMISILTSSSFIDLTTSSSISLTHRSGTTATNSMTALPTSRSIRSSMTSSSASSDVSSSTQSTYYPNSETSQSLGMSTSSTTTSHPGTKSTLSPKPSDSSTALKVSGVTSNLIQSSLTSMATSGSSTSVSPKSVSSLTTSLKSSVSAMTTTTHPQSLTSSTTSLIHQASSGNSPIQTSITSTSTLSTSTLKASTSNASATSISSSNISTTSTSTSSASASSTSTHSSTTSKSSLSSSTGYLTLVSPTPCSFGDLPGTDQDDSYCIINLPSPMVIYGAQDTRTLASTNGYISLTDGSSQYQAQPLPDAHLPSNTVAPFFDDLYIYGNATPTQGIFYNADSTGVTYEYYLSRAGQQQEIFHFTVSYAFANSGSFTFQYIQVGSGDNGKYAAVGLQSEIASGSPQGYSYSFRNQIITPGLTLLCGSNDSKNCTVVV